MQRRVTTLFKPSGSKNRESYYDKKDSSDDGDSKVSTVVPNEPLPVPSLKVKRVDNYYSRWSKTWKYRNTSSKVTVETLPVIQSATNDAWKEYSFVIVRTLPREENKEPTFKVIIKSEYILKACKDVIQSWPGISWNTDPLELKPEVLLTFFEKFIEYRDELSSKKRLTTQESHILSSVSLLISTLTSDYRTTLGTINRLTAHGEITFEHLYAILIPRTLFVATCALTGLPRLFKLISWTPVELDGKRILYKLICESVDLVDQPLTHNVEVGRVETVIYLQKFAGTVKIDSLDAYPVKYDKNERALREEAIARGKKWVGLIGVHHMEYDGIAAFKCGDKTVRHNVRSRIMVDRATFRRLNANYPIPSPVKSIPDPSLGPPTPPPASYDSYGNFIPQEPAPVPGQYTNEGLISRIGPTDVTADVDMKEEDLLLAPTTVFGFSLADKAWLEFNVSKVQNVSWNTDAFANLVLPSTRKDLLQSLVEAHHKELGFDDFIKGKGHGLVVNLFGPPGVGKTFSAEATSEHVKRPLYVIGGGDLGTTAAALDLALEKVFDVATAWKAIVLIDEADVFLEQRSMHDLERNAMVAVFLRHVEYYRGILFLTTNRVKAFDEAFLSRIHVALHFHELTQSSKEQVWRAFIGKIGASEAISDEEVKLLAKRDVNGRQIKNAAKTAHSLAVGRGEQVKFSHLMLALDGMEEFTREFEGRRGEYMSG